MLLHMLEPGSFFLLREGFLFRGREALGGLEAGKPGGARSTTKETPGRGQEKERKKSRESKKSKYSVMKKDQMQTKTRAVAQKRVWVARCGCELKKIRL